MKHKKLAALSLAFGLTLALGMPVTGAPSAQAAGRPNTIPALREWTEGAGRYTFSSASRIVYNGPALAEDAATFADDLLQMTGFILPTVNGQSGNPGDIYLTLGATDPAIGSEGYRLTISSSVTISAQTATGAFYGTRTILQLLKQSYTIAAGNARDWPSYPQRGLMVDNGRKYFTVTWLQNHIKDLAYLKLNYFHWHLSDNLGFRLESASHPEIVSAQHYTKAEIQALLTLAAKYHVMITPEIDMPGHMDALLAGHPELQLANSAGVKNPGKIDLSLDAAYTFMNDLLQEYLPLFTGPYWHVGADEYLTNYAPYPQLLTYAQTHSGAAANAKDTYLGFVNWVDGIVKAHGKTLRMWNDGLEGGAAVTVNADIVVEHWTGRPDPQSLLNEGHFLMNSNGDYLYYVLGDLWKPSNFTLYEDWEPHMFRGNQNIAANDPQQYGAKLQVWCDHPNTETEDQVAAGIKSLLRSVAQKTWATTRLVTTYVAFTPIISAIGRAPGTTFNDGPPGGDLALGKPATVSSVQGRTGFIGNLAVDGDYGTRWSSQSTDSQWIYVDLGQTYTITRVKLNWEAAYGQAYQIQVSNEATHWTTIYNTTTGDGGVDDLNGLSGSGRYVRLYGARRATRWGYSLWEFEVYDRSSATPTPTWTHTSSPPTATATLKPRPDSSVCCVEGTSPTQVLDDNLQHDKRRRRD